MLAILFQPAAASPYLIQGRVIAVTDGDSITLLDPDNAQHKIRIDGIDAPEKAQAFGDRSRQSLRALAHGRDAEVKCHKTDRYGRHVCVVLVDRIDVGLGQIRAGMAWHFKHYQNEQSPEARAAYAEAERRAREERRGLWRDVGAVPPWEFRRRSRGT